MTDHIIELKKLRDSESCPIKRDLLDASYREACNKFTQNITAHRPSSDTYYISGTSHGQYGGTSYPMHIGISPLSSVSFTQSPVYLGWSNK